jgi:hypothetical protein
VVGHAAGNRGFEAVIDHPLGGGDLGGLGLAQRALPAEHLLLEGTAMVEGLDIKRAVVSAGHQAVPLSLR